MKFSFAPFASALALAAGWSSAALAQGDPASGLEPATHVPDPAAPGGEVADSDEPLEESASPVGALPASSAIIEEGPPPDFSSSTKIRLNAPPVEPAVGRDGYDDEAPPLVGGDLWIGGYGGISASHANFFGNDGALVGVEGAVLLNRRLSIGMAAYGFTNPASAPRLDSIDRDLEVGYGGLVGRYSFLFGSPVYVTVGALVGPGVIVAAPHRESWGEDDWDDDDYRDRYERDDDVRREHVDVFTVVQPEATLHLNVTRWARLGVTVGYRAAFEVGKFGKDNDDVSGLVAGANLQFGRF